MNSKDVPEDHLVGAVKLENDAADTSSITYKKGTFPDLDTSAKENILNDTIVNDKVAIDNTKTQAPPKKTPKKVIPKSPEKNSDGDVRKKKKRRKKTTRPAKKNKFAPKISFSETTWNFGEIMEGDVVDKEFEFTNTGDAPLQILIAKATCGCTQPTFPFLEIAPGDKGIIGVRYNSVGKNGEQNPIVTVEANTYPKSTILNITGTVKPKPKKEEKKDQEEEIVKDKPAEKDSIKN